MNLLQIIGYNIRTQRQKRNMSQEDLANKSKVSKATIGRLERYEFDPKISTVEKLAKALNIDVVKLVKQR